jgi:O-antigen ligase
MDPSNSLSSEETFNQDTERGHLGYTLRNAVHQFASGEHRGRMLSQGAALLLGLFVFFNPIPHTTAIKEFLFYTSVGVALYLVATRIIRPCLHTPFSWFFLLVVLWSLFGLVSAIDKPNSLHDIYEHLIKLILLFFLLVTFFPTRRHLELLQGMVILSVTLFCVGGLIYYYFILGHDLTERFGHSLRYSFFEMSANYMGYSTVFAASLALSSALREHRRSLCAFYGICFLILSVATLLTQTRGAILALWVVFIVPLLAERRWALLLFLFLFCLGTLFMTGKSDRFDARQFLQNERLGTSLMYLELVKDHPVTGIGFGMEILQKKNFLEPYYKRVPEGSRDPGYRVSPHNLYLDVTVRLGLVGLALYLTIIVTAFFLSWQSLRGAADGWLRGEALCLLASFSAYLIQAFFADASFGSPAIVFYLHLAMITILRSLGQTPQPADERENQPR